MNYRRRLAILTLTAIVIVLQCAAGQQAQPTVAALSNIDLRFFSQLKEAAARTDLEKTKKSGGGGGGSFAEVLPDGGIVVGFDVWQGSWAGHRIIRGVRPIFQTAIGRVRGKSHGNTPGKPSVTVEANEGYAVAALEAKGGERLDGFQVLFWKIRPTMMRLDADGAYKSEWIGGEGGGKAKHPLSSDGRPVLGISGASGADIDRLGLIYAGPK
jgi:hypothetical protein